MVGESPSGAPNLVARANVLLPGLYAWLTTVAAPSVSTSAPVLARVAAGAALLALVGGAAAGLFRPRLGRVLGLAVFMGLCVVCWLALGPILSVERIEPVRAALGAVAWGLFAFGWGDVRKPGEVPEDNPRADIREMLKARRELPRFAYAVFSAALVGGLVPVFLAWRVVRREHSLLAHAAAVACAIAMVSSGARVAVARGMWKPRGAPVRRLNHAVLPLTAVAVLALVGLAKLVID